MKSADYTLILFAMRYALTRDYRAARLAVPDITGRWAGLLRGEKNTIQTELAYDIKHAKDWDETKTREWRQLLSWIGERFPATGAP